MLLPAVNPHPKFSFTISIKAILMALLATVLSTVGIAQPTNTTYHDSISGWSVQYPSAIPMLTEAEIAALEGRGQEAIESSMDQKFEGFTHRNLLWIRKDIFNSITSNIQPYDASTDGDYKEMQDMILEVIKQTYSDQGIEFDSRVDKTTIDGLDFNTTYFTLFMPDRSKVLMHQVLYDRLIDGKYSLTINVNYNDVGKEELMQIINSSKFSKRN